MLAVTPMPGQRVVEPVFKTANVNGKTYRAYTYGRRDRQQTKVNISVQGVALDGALAVHETPLRVLDVGEIAPIGTAVENICPISGRRTVIPRSAEVRGAFNTAAPTAVQVANTVYQLCHTEHIAAFEEQLIAREDNAGPYDGSLTMGAS